ncbi:MAG: hypothetical protein MJ236_00905 [Clostridia bacterium]|nr:hypothetical protein [Clostridia bacterium]
MNNDKTIVISFGANPPYKVDVDEYFYDSLRENLENKEILMLREVGLVCPKVDRAEIVNVNTLIDTIKSVPKSTMLLLDDDKDFRGIGVDGGCYSFTHFRQLVDGIPENIKEMLNDRCIDKTIDVSDVITFTSPIGDCVSKALGVSLDSPCVSTNQRVEEMQR